MRRYLIEIDSTARPEVTDAEVLRCLRERFPEVRGFTSEAQVLAKGSKSAWLLGPELTRTNPWKDE